MQIAVIGGGFTGLSAAYELSKNGHRVTIFEKDKNLGGLAGGFSGSPPGGGWSWPLEKAYHHWFTNDFSVIRLAKELGLKNKLVIKRPVTANFWHGKIYPFDSPINLLKYPGLTAGDKFRTAAFIFLLKLDPLWQPLENLTAENLIRLINGNHAWQELWEPLMKAKFGDYSSKVAASWFWARIKKRTPGLGYIEGGFQTLVSALALNIRKNGGVIRTDATITGIKKIDRGFVIAGSRFDRVLLTVPTPIALKLLPHFSLKSSILNLTSSIPHLHAQTLILETKEPILKSVYWLNVLDRKFPFLAVVAHTNFMDPANYGGHHLTYFGNYLPAGHPYLSLTNKQLLKIFDPFIKKFSHAYHLSDFGSAQGKLINSYLFTAPFAQPVHQLHYSEIAPKLETGLPGVYLANLDSIYPWDRGTNYAVELGIKAALKISKAV